MKKLWKSNRVVFVLVIILIICFIAICSVALTFFYSKDTNEYGNRLNGIEKHPISSELKSNYKETLLANESVKSVEFNTKGRIIYVNIKFDENISLDNAKKLVEDNLSIFNEDILSYYDLQFVLSSDNFTIMASKNVASEKISWNNNTPIKEEENEEEK